MVQMSNNPAYHILRIKFTKTGNLQYISHLDLVRTMHRIVVRAKLPLWYTEGFNPKPKLVFAAPLSIGAESIVEFMDIRVTELLPLEEIKDRLNENTTDEMRITDVYYPSTHITDLAYLSYQIRIKTVGVSEELATACRDALAKPRIEILKKTKSGDAKVDVKPLIKDISVTKDGEELVFDATLSADPSSYLNPEYIVKYLRESVGILSDSNITNEWYSILRTKAFCKDMSEFR